MPRDFWKSYGRIYTGWDEELDLENVEPYQDQDWTEQLDIDGFSSSGYATVDFEQLARHMADIAYIEAKERYRQMTPEQKEHEYFRRRKQRASRDGEQMRRDSIKRHARPYYLEFESQREIGWQYGDPDYIQQIDALDKTAAFQLAREWRMEEDERKLDALIVKYAAWLEDRDPKIIRQRFRRKNGERHQQIAEFVYVTDALATGVVMPGGFNVEALMSQIGDELELSMVTPRSDRERRIWMIEQAADFYQSGALFPPYVYASLEPMLAEVIQILEAAGVDTQPPQEDIDWSAV